MATIIAYQKYIDALITRELLMPTDESNNQIGTELATVVGITYVCLPDGSTLPSEQPQEISSTISVVTLTTEQIAEIKAASPHVRLINNRVAKMIDVEYSMADEIKLLRTAPSTEFDTYNAFIEYCRAWGNSEKAKIGLA